MAEWDQMRSRLNILVEENRWLKVSNASSDRPPMERARQHLALATAVISELPDPGTRWGAYAKATRERIESFRGPVDAILFAQSSDSGFETRAVSARLESLAAQEEKNLAAEFPRFSDTIGQWSESIYSDPATTIEYRGRPVSTPMYLLMSYCFSCLNRLAPSVVCEIGGGYGAPARLWLTNPIHRPSQYIIIDLPESLFFAELYLAKHFGAEQVFYMTNRSKTTIERLATAPIVLCPNGLIGMLESLKIDLALNTNSMQEMSEGYIDFFMHWLDKLDCSFFFSQNYALQDARTPHESRNMWSPRMTAIWETVFLKHDGVHTERPTQQALYRKAEENVGERLTAASIAMSKLLQDPLDNIVLARLLDLVRLDMNPASVTKLIGKIRAEYKFIPKEAKYLELWLAERGG